MEFVIGLRLRLDHFAFVFGLVFVVASVQIVFVCLEQIIVCFGRSDSWSDSRQSRRRRLALLFCLSCMVVLLLMMLLIYDVHGRSDVPRLL